MLHNASIAQTHTHIKYKISSEEETNKTKMNGKYTMVRTYENVYLNDEKKENSRTNNIHEWQLQRYSNRGTATHVHIHERDETAAHKRNSNNRCKF